MEEMLGTYKQQIDVRYTRLPHIFTAVGRIKWLDNLFTTAQLIIFIRMVFDDFNVKEELLKNITFIWEDNG